MRFDDFIEQAEIIEELRAEDAKNQMVSGAWIAWQSGAGGKKSFGEYLKSMGLSEKPVEITGAQRKAIADRAKGKAEKILRMDKKRRKHK